MDKSVIRFLRRFGEDGKPIETNYDVALVCLNELRHIVGQPVVVAYYTQDPTTKNPMDPKTGENCRINAVTAIGIKNGIGPDCYSIISNGEIEQVHLVSDTTVDDVSKLVNGLVAVCYDKDKDDKDKVPCYCRYDEDTDSRIFTPIEGDRTFYSGYDGFLWYVSHGIIKRSDDFMSRDDIKEYVESLLQNLDLNDLKGNQDIEWTDKDASKDYTKIVEIPSGNSLILSVNIISEGGKVETEMLYYTSTGDPDMPEYSLATDRFYEYRSVPSEPGGICIKSKKKSDPTTTYKFKVIYSSDPKNTIWCNNELQTSRPDLTTKPTTNLEATTKENFKKFIRLGSEGTVVTSEDNSIDIKEIAGGYDIRSNSKYEKEFKYVRESKTELGFLSGIEASHWVSILNIPRNNKYLEKLPFLIYIYDDKDKVGGLVTLNINSKPSEIITGDYRFNKLFINYLELGLTSNATEYNIWFRVRDKEYSNLTFKVLSAPVNNWKYTTEGYDYSKPDINPYITSTSSSILSFTFKTSSENVVTKESEKLITSGAVWYELDELKKIINNGFGGLGEGIEEIIIGNKTYSDSTVNLTDVVEVLSNKVTTIDENSTDTQYPSAKAVYLLFKGLDTKITTIEEDITNIKEDLKGTIKSVTVSNGYDENGKLLTTSVSPVEDSTDADISEYVESSNNKVSFLPDDDTNDDNLYPSISLVRSIMRGGNSLVTVKNSFDTAGNKPYQAALKITSIPCKVDVNYSDISGGKCSDTLYIIDRDNSGDISLRTNTTSNVFSLIYEGGSYYVCIPAKKFSENEVTCSYSFNGTSIGSFSKSNIFYVDEVVESEYVGADSVYYGKDITLVTNNSNITGFDFNQYTNILYTGTGKTVKILNSSLNSLPEKSKVFHFVNSTENILSEVTIEGLADSLENHPSDKIENVLPGSEVLFTYLESEGKIIHEVRLQKFYSSDNTITIEKTGNTWDFRNKASGGVVTLYITKDNMDEYLVPIFDEWGSADGHGEQSYEGLYGRYLINAFELRLPESWRDVNVFIDQDTYTSKFSTPNNGFIYRICPKFYNSEDKSISPSNGARVTLSGKFRLGFSIDGLNSSKTEETSNGLMHYYYGNVKNNMLDTDTSLLTVGNTIGVTTEALNSNNGWDGVETVEVNDKSYTGYVYDSTKYFDKLPSDKRFIDFINWNGVWYCNGLYNPNVFSGKVTQAVGGITLKTVYTNESIAKVLEDMLCPYVQYKGLSHSNINICTNDIPTTISLKASATLGSKPLTIKIKDSSEDKIELKTITSSNTQDVGDTLTNTVTLPIKKTEGNTTTITTPIPTVSTKFLVDFTDGENSDSDKELWVNIYEPIYLFEYVNADIESLTESYIDKLGKDCSLFNSSGTGSGETTFENSKLKVTGIGKARSLCIAVPTAHLTKTKDTFAITKIVNVMSEITTAFVNTKITAGRYTVFYEYIASPSEGYFYKAYQFKGNTKI